jgi:hypothetical protein
LYGTTATTLSVAPNGVITQYGGFLFEKYELNIRNGQPRDATYNLSATGLDRLFLDRKTTTVKIARSADRAITLTLAAPLGALAPGRRYLIEITAQSTQHGGQSHSVSTIFYVPGPPVPTKAG